MVGDKLKKAMAQAEEAADLKQRDARWRDWMAGAEKAFLSEGGESLVAHVAAVALHGELAGIWLSHQESTMKYCPGVLYVGGGSQSGSGATLLIEDDRQFHFTHRNMDPYVWLTYEKFRGDRKHVTAQWHPASLTVEGIFREAYEIGLRVARFMAGEDVAPL